MLEFTCTKKQQGGCSREYFNTDSARVNRKITESGYFRRTWSLFRVGEIKYRRRYYQNRKTGQRASLLDAMTGVEKYSKIETNYALRIIENSTKMSYEKAGNITQNES